MTRVSTLEELDRFLAMAEQEPTDDQRRSAWATLKIASEVFRDFPARLASLDPFGSEYAACVRGFMRFLRGREYSLHAEGFNHDLAPLLRTGFPYATCSPATVGSYLISYGFVIRAMNLAVPSKILEIGCGFGSLSTHLARMGYDLTAVDVNENFVEHVRELTKGAPGQVKCIASDMNSLDLPREYDGVLFYESFHHSSDHRETVRRSLDFLKEDGMLVLAAEPVVTEPSEVVPYPWGPRLDGETLRAIRRFGWMELGFTETYLYELLSRNGLVWQKISSRETHWADLIIARRAGTAAPQVTYHCATLGNGTRFLASGWSQPESFGTWSEGNISYLVLDLQAQAGRTIEIFFNVIPFLPPARPQLTVQIVANGILSTGWRFSSSGARMEWKPSTRKIVLSPVQFNGRVLRLTFLIDQPLSPKEAGLTSDERRIGFALAGFRYNVR
jgi:SAM-dependent methyltransferase